MNGTMSRLVYWIPRIACIAFAAFLAVFALDVFTEPYGLAHKAFALMMHLIPSGIVVVALILAWRREWIGGVLFPLLAGFHLWSFWGRLDVSGYAIIEGPLLLLGVLFWINWFNRTGRRAGVAV